MMGGSVDMKAITEKLAVEHGVPPAIADQFISKAQEMISSGASADEITALAEQYGVSPQAVEMVKGMIAKTAASQTPHA